MMGTKALELLYKQRDNFRGLVQLAELAPTKEVKLQLPLIRAQLEDVERTIQCIEEGKPLLASWYANAPEIYTAMDLHWYCVGTAPILGMDKQILEEVDALRIPGDVCTLNRMMLAALELGTMPIPTAMVVMATPCDALPIIQEALNQHKDWRNVPSFALDQPYWEDERSIDYHAGEYKRMVSFLEEHTGKKLDIDRLREVIEESNKQYEVWMEYNELKRAVPAPHRSFSSDSFFAMTQLMASTAASPAATDYMRAMLADAEEQVRAKKGGLENERIRLFWFDVRSLWSEELFQWLEQEWGANFVMSMFGYCPYTTIDTSTEDSMFRGIAKRYLYDTPMVRQARGRMDNFLDDIWRVVKDYKIDCFVWPGHMGHKDGAASVGAMREVCRDLGVPFLTIGLDLWDPRYTTIDVIKDRFSQFFKAMGLG